MAIAAIVLAMTSLHAQLATLAGFDQNVTAAVHAHQSATLTTVARGLSLLGSVPSTYAITLILAALLWSERDRLGAVLLVIAIAGAATLNTTLKLHFHRLRPGVPWVLAHEKSFSFPSGHALYATVLYGMICYLLVTRIRNPAALIAIFAAALAMVLGIGLSRVYLGVHFPTDVAAGYMTGLLWLAAMLFSDWNLRRTTFR